MRLLLDQNLSWRLVRLLESNFPDVVHVSTVGLSQATDLQIWAYASTHEYIIIPKDSDFQNFAQITEAFPKFIWLQMPRVSTTVIAKNLLDQYEQILEFCQSTDAQLILNVRPPEETATT